MTSDKILEQLEYLPDYLGHHLALTLSALALSVVICLPLAILVTRIRFLQWPTLAFASVTQTIPGIALLAVMVILLGKIGFVPALIALFLYSMLPILRNTVTGITGVEPSLVEAAYGVGMTPNQVLRKVELPLALPVIIAGIRTSAVWVVGTATLSTPVGATSLGNYIFSGLQTQNSSAVLVGCLSAVFLAITIDQLIHLVQIASLRRKFLPALVAGIGFVVLVAGAIYPMVAKSSSQSVRGHIVIGAKPFTEQYILSQLIADVLNDAG
ncbi:MAG: ABC transporter permease/substrate-binding protein, partial [candidate division Zixibacteria bacterium]|nr:ABC transporter permease/substrate-binding protein [candidate division Zixibacteria bacterium]